MGNPQRLDHPPEIKGLMILCLMIWHRIFWWKMLLRHFLFDLRGIINLCLPTGGGKFGDTAAAAVFSVKIWKLFVLWWSHWEKHDYVRYVKLPRKMSVWVGLLVTLLFFVFRSVPSVLAARVQTCISLKQICSSSINLSHDLRWPMPLRRPRGLVIAASLPCQCVAHGGSHTAAVRATKVVKFGQRQVCEAKTTTIWHMHLDF